MRRSGINLEKIVKWGCIIGGGILSIIGTMITSKPEELPADAIETEPVSVEDTPAETSEPAAE